MAGIGGGERGRERKKKKEKKERGGREEGKICKFLLFLKVLCGILQSNADNSWPHNKRTTPTSFSALPNTSTHVNSSYEHHFFHRVLYGIP